MRQFAQKRNSGDACTMAIESIDMSAPGREGPLDHLSPEEKEIFFRFLILVRDNYRKADKAAHFLERRANVVNTASMANLRDVLSHMATLLDPRTPALRRSDQLASAEEHLRRAIIEPYELGLGELTQKFGPVYDSYRGRVIPLMETEGFRTAPNRVEIDNRLRDVDDLAEKGKYAKGRNLWDEEWEAGIEALIEAYDQLSSLHHEIEEWVFKSRQHHVSAHHTWLHRWAIALAIGGIIVGIVFGYLFTRYGPVISISPRSSIVSPNGASKSPRN
jgi:hypothetical protein